MPHAPHEYLSTKQSPLEDGNPGSTRTESVYAKCDGVLPSDGSVALPDELRSHRTYPARHILEAVNDEEAESFIKSLTRDEMTEIIRAAINAGVDYGETFGLNYRFLAEVSKRPIIYPHIAITPAEKVEGMRFLQEPFEFLPLMIPNTRPEGWTGDDDDAELVAVANKAIGNIGNRIVVIDPSAPKLSIDYGYPIEPQISAIAMEDIVPIDSDLWRILNEYLPEIDARMRISGEHYGYETHNDLGLRGQYVDMYRKWCMLKRIMWEGHKTTREPLREILMDMIGHCLLSVAVVDKGVDPE